MDKISWFFLTFRLCSLIERLYASLSLKHTVPYKVFLSCFMNKGMATDIKLKNYIMYKYNDRIKEKEKRLILNAINNKYWVKIWGAAVPPCLDMSCHRFWIKLYIFQSSVLPEKHFMSMWNLQLRIMSICLSEIIIFLKPSKYNDRN